MEQQELLPQLLLLLLLFCFCGAWVIESRASSILGNAQPLSHTTSLENKEYLLKGAYPHTHPTTQ